MAENTKVLGTRAWEKLTGKDEITIGVAIITRNRIEQLKRLLPQLTKMDQVVVCDTGSQDGTERYVRSLGKPFQYLRHPWRDNPTKKHPEFAFSDARNASFDALKTTYAVWLDTDDMVGKMKGNKPILASPDQIYGVFKKIIVEANPITDVWYINYVYGRDIDGNPISINTRERMVKMDKGWRWIWPVHENLVPPTERHPAVVSDIDIIHFPDEVVKGSADRNLKISQKWLAFMEENSGSEMDLMRCKLNVGESLNALGQWKESADFLVRRFLNEHPRALDMEKWHAWVMVANAQIELGNWEAAKAASLACISIEPGLSDGYILLGQAKFLADEDPQDVLILMETAASKEEPPSQMISNPLNYTFTPFCIISDCKFQLGQYADALQWAVKALKISPSDVRAEKLRIQAADMIRKRDTAEAVKALYMFLKDYEENEKASKLYDYIPYVAQQNPDVQELARAAYQRVRHLYDVAEYTKLYEENNHWTPAKDEWIENETPPGFDRYVYTLGRLKAALPNGGRIIDVGCSDGFHSVLYAKHGYEVVGVDISKTAVKLANERAEKLGVKATFIEGFFENMEPTRMADPFDPSQNWFQHFDAAICGEVIEHVQDPALLLGCLGDVVKDNAPIILTTPDEAFDKGEIPSWGGSPDNDGLVGHVRAFTQESFEGLLRSNSEFDCVESHFLPVITGVGLHEHQGWQVGEIRRRDRANGPVIRVFCGDNTKFSPSDVDTGGIGGSETAVVYMAKAWAQMGCQVVVYTAGEPGIHDGVWYRHSSQFDVQHRSDVFISWRIPTAFQYGRPNATTTIFWCHDLGYPIQLPGLPKNEFPKEWVDAMDYVMVLSKFHEKYITGFHKCLKGKTFLTRNGIDLGRFANKDIKKVAHRYFYSSSYDRGLEELLAVWPSIKKEIPDAELHVCYGLEVAEQLCKQIGDMERLNWLYSIANKMKQLPGIVSHERIGQRELAELQQSCEAWLYPPQPDSNGGWLETYCITALEAQAAKCKIISRDNGALPETIKHALWWRRSDEVGEGWIVDTLKNLDEKWDKVWTKENYDWATSQTWDGVAVDWARELSKRAEAQEVVEV